MGYTKNAISGFSWQTLLKLIQNGLSVVKIFILARLLSPEDFGMFSLITISLGLVEAFTETGINFTILESKKSTLYFLDTAWVIAIVRGFIIAILMVLLGIGMGVFYSEPLLPTYIAIAALVPLIKGFINPNIISLHKDLLFFKDSAYRLSLSLVDVFFAVLLGLWLHSFMALVIAMIATAFFEVFISFVFFKAKPAFKYIHSRAQSIYSNARWLSISALLSYTHENIDNFILGKTIGTYNLGLYHNGYSIGHKLNYEIAKSAQHGTLPIYTKISTEKERLMSAFLRSSVVTLGIATILSLPLFFFPELIVRIVLGEEWLQIVPLVPFLTLAGLLQALSVNFSSLLLATKRFNYINTHLFVTLCILVPLIMSMSKNDGLMGAALALIISRSVSFPILLWGARTIFKS